MSVPWQGLPAQSGGHILPRSESHGRAAPAASRTGAQSYREGNPSKGVESSFSVSLPAASTWLGQNQGLNLHVHWIGKEKVRCALVPRVWEILRVSSGGYFDDFDDTYIATCRAFSWLPRDDPNPFGTFVFVNGNKCGLPSMLSPIASF